MRLPLACVLGVKEVFNILGCLTAIIGLVLIFLVCGLICKVSIELAFWVLLSGLVCLVLMDFIDEG